MNLPDGKSLIIVGPQGSAKPALARKIADDSNGKYKYINGCLSATQMKLIVTRDPRQQFIFTTSEQLDHSSKQGSRRFVFKTVSELT